MDICYNCKGPVEKVVGTIVVDGIKMEDIPFEQCRQCKERYYDENTAAFIQRISNYIKEQRHELLKQKFS